MADAEEDGKLKVEHFLYPWSGLVSDLRHRPNPEIGGRSVRPNVVSRHSRRRAMHPSNESLSYTEGRRVFFFGMKEIEQMSKAPETNLIGWDANGVFVFSAKE